MQKFVILTILAVCVAVCSARPATTEQASNSVSSKFNKHNFDVKFQTLTYSYRWAAFL